jgi:hypothetical protein
MTPTSFVRNHAAEGEFRTKLGGAATGFVRNHATEGEFRTKLDDGGRR